MPRLRPQGLDADAVLAPLREFNSVGLAVSGGPDSLALMILASRIGGPRFIVYTVDHGLRPEAAGEAAMVVREAEKLGLSARALRWGGRKPETGLQQAARRVRYQLIGLAMEADGAEVLATAHHLHDQAETVLMRLAHGSGIEGLRGMDLFAEVEGVTLVRPLLGVDPSDLRAVVEAAGLAPTIDPSNADVGYERVRWRKMLPQLAALGLTPERLSLFALRMRDADRALNAMTARVSTGVDLATGARSLRVDDLRRVPRAVGVQVVARLLDEVGAGAKPHALAAVEALTDRLIREPLKATLHGCIVTSDGAVIRIAREPLSGARARRSVADQSS
jgi:tRNA(Ile)-lysidine synthase